MHHLTLMQTKSYSTQDKSKTPLDHSPNNTLSTIQHPSFDKKQRKDNTKSYKVYPQLHMIHERRCSLHTNLWKTIKIQRFLKNPKNQSQDHIRGYTHTHTHTKVKSINNK
jgi:hypothetical protein